MPRPASLIKRVSPATTSTQAELFTVETVEGYAQLAARERLFAQALFEGKNQREAARAAGFKGDDKRLDEQASRYVRTAKVRALMNHAWARSGANLDDTLRQAAELQRVSYAEAIAEQNAHRREKAIGQWVKVATLIASIHGRLSLKIDTNVTHSGQVALVIPPTALPVLAQMRRDVITPPEASHARN